MSFILFIDKEHPCNLVSRFLKSQFSQCTYTNNIAKAFEVYRQNRPLVTLINVDILKNGNVNYLELFTGNRTSDSKVIILCDEPSVSAEKLGSLIFAGADDYLIKPYDLELLSFKLYQLGVIAQNVSKAA